MRWSKLILYRNRTLLVPVPKIDHSRLCPHRAIVHAFKLLAAHDSAKLRNGPAFVYTSGDQVKPLTYTTFTTKLKSCLSNLNLTAPSTLDTLFVAEEPPLRWTVESLGTTSNFKDRDWLSNAYERYLDTSLLYKIITVNLMSNSITHWFPHHFFGGICGASRTVLGNKDPVTPNWVGVYLVSDRLVYNN